MINGEFYYKTIMEIGAELRAGTISSEALTAAMLARIEVLEPRLRAYVNVMAQTAFAQAREADKALQAGRDLSPLQGIPIAIKDLCDIKGEVTTAGTTLFAERVAATDATVVRKLIDAGAVVLGKLKLTEGAFSSHHPDIEPPRNPWDSERWAGVSSSGSGVATAAGLCFGSLGSDTGGSIRFPSACNGIVGLKPTWGRVSRAGVFPLADTLDHIGPMARTVADAAAMLGVIAGADPRDTTASHRSVPDYLAQLKHDISGLRIGYDERYCSLYVDAEMVDAIHSAVAVLKDAGATIVPCKVPAVEELEAGWLITCGVEVAMAHRDTYPSRAGEYGGALKSIIDVGRSATAHQYGALEIARRKFSGALAALLSEVDLIICPSMPRAAPLTDSLGGALEKEPMRALRFTAPFDYSGNPTLSLPWGFSQSGMPLGVQLVAASFAEPTLIRAGHFLEQSAHWHRSHPDI